MPHEFSNFELNDLLARNESEETIPPYSIAEVQNTELVGGKRPKVLITKPTGNGVLFVATGPIPLLPDGGYDEQVVHARSFDTRRWVKYSGDAPEHGDTVGPTEDSWEVSTDGTGYRVWGVDETKGLALIEQVPEGGTGVLTIRFRLIEPIDCDKCRADAVVLSRPPGLSVVPGEDPYTDVVQVRDYMGFLNEPADDLVNRVGYATYLTGPRPLNCEPEEDEDQYTRTATAWEITSLTCKEATCGDGDDF